VKDRLTLVNWSVAELNENDQVTVLLLTPVSGPEKLSDEPAEAQIDTASTNIPHIAASLE
jgi:hypothetical protein